MGIRGQVTTGDECAHIDVVGKDIVTNELAEEQHQVRELHTLTLITRLRCTEGDRDSAGDQTCDGLFMTVKAT